MVAAVASAAARGFLKGMLWPSREPPCGFRGLRSLAALAAALAFTQKVNEDFPNMDEIPEGY
jgi:hypothetical protein